MQQQQKPFSESGTSPPRRLTLQGVRWAPARTFVFGWGSDDKGHSTLFSSDWRTMLRLADMLDAGIPVEVWITDSQVLAFRRACR